MRMGDVGKIWMLDQRSASRFQFVQHSCGSHDPVSQEFLNFKFHIRRHVLPRRADGIYNRGEPRTYSISCYSVEIAVRRRNSMPSWQNVPADEACARAGRVEPITISGKRCLTNWLSRNSSSLSFSP